MQGAWGEGVIHSCGEMTAVGFIHQYAKALLLQPLNYRRRVIGIALVGGMHQNRSTDGCSVRGQSLQHPFDPSCICRCRLAAVALEGEIEQDRPQVAKNAGLNQAAMDIAGQQDPLSWPDHGQQCGLQQPRGPVHPIPAARHTHLCSGGALACCDGAVSFQRTAKGWQFRQVPDASAAAQQLTKSIRKGSPPSMGRQKQGLTDSTGELGQKRHRIRLISLKSPSVLIALRCVTTPGGIWAGYCCVPGLPSRA